MGLTDFSPEVLTRIFLHLPYHSLLSVSAVCVQWNAIVAKDPGLSVQMFKKLSKVYVEPGCGETEKGPWATRVNIFDIAEEALQRDTKYTHFKLTMPTEDGDRIKSAWVQAHGNVVAATALLADSKWKPRPAPGRIRIHPAIESASYLFGRGLDSVEFFGKEDTNFKLVDLAIANDFISIPAVTTATLDVGPTCFTVKVKNSKGITLADLFGAMDKEANVKVKRGRQSISNAELLGDHLFYEGFNNLMRVGSSLSAEMHLGS
ncbi:hypothetical protein DFH06DRAFT_471842 [Mycena polygramma]|nr:hypothetical protein DFH06DRAFT_471842 [Mycena polygramma]